MPSALRLQSLVAYVVSKLVDMGASFGKTKLVKLLYLIDVENHRIRSRKLTALEWTFYHYGPYAFEIDQILKQLDLEIPQEDVLTASGHQATVFRPPWDADVEFEEQASTSEKLVVDHVIQEWGMEELNPILSYVYFHTEPMKDAKRGEVLDFSRIQKVPALRRVEPASKLPSCRVKELRDEFENVKAIRFRQARRSLDPKPRLDDIFWQCLAHLDSQEQYSVPRGDIELDEQFKQHVRQQTELER